MICLYQRLVEEIQVISEKGPQVDQKEGLLFDESTKLNEETPDHKLSSLLSQRILRRTTIQQSLHIPSKL